MKRTAGLRTAAILVLLFGLGTSALAAEKLYTAHNIWYESPQKVYSTNYSKGALLPAGSEVSGVARTAKALEFVEAKTNTKFTIEFMAKHHPGVTADQFANRFLTPKDFSQLTAGLTAEEISAIKAGEVRTGMSKQAVLVARGYPPETGTPSTDSNSWKYWHDRFRTYLVEFSDGKVVRTGR